MFGWVILILFVVILYFVKLDFNLEMQSGSKFSLYKPSNSIFMSVSLK